MRVIVIPAIGIAVVPSLLASRFGAVCSWHPAAVSQLQGRDVVDADIREEPHGLFGVGVRLAEQFPEVGAARHDSVDGSRQDLEGEVSTRARLHAEVRREPVLERPSCSPAAFLGGHKHRNSHCHLATFCTLNRDPSGILCDLWPRLLHVRSLLRERTVRSQQTKATNKTNQKAPTKLIYKRSNYLFALCKCSNQIYVPRVLRQPQSPPLCLKTTTKAPHCALRHGS